MFAAVVKHTMGDYWGGGGGWYPGDGRNWRPVCAPRGGHTYQGYYYHHIVCHIDDQINHPSKL